MRGMLRALILDFDGLVLDTETPIIDAYEQVYQRHGVPFERAPFRANIGHAEYGFNPWSAFGPEAAVEALEEERRTINRALTELQPLLPGVRSTLEQAQARGLKLGMASNSSHGWVEPHMHRLGLHGFIQFFGCRGDTPSPKPEPDIYRFVANNLGIRPSEALALEDSGTGVLAAHRAGMKVVAIPNASTASHDFKHADLVLRSMEDLDLDKLSQILDPS